MTPLSEPAATENPHEFHAGNRWNPAARVTLEVVAALGLQMVLISAAIFLAWLLRFEFSIPAKYTPYLFKLSPLLLAIRLATLYVFNLHRGWWRYFGVRDVVNILRAGALGTVIFWVLLHSFATINDWPRSIYILEAILSTMFLFGARLSFRLVRDTVRKDMRTGKRTLLLGAGAASNMLLREILEKNLGILPIGMVDDDRSKKGVRVQGLPVFGTVDDIPALVQKHSIDEVLIVVPSATGRQMQRFTGICEAANVPFRTVPGLSEIISGRVQLQQIREVCLEDLLGRETADIDAASLGLILGGKNVLVTGAAGSIGSELCRQIIKYSPASLVCLDQNENGLFYLQDDLRSADEATQVEYRVADLTDARSLGRIFGERPPDVIFHAAAYKHVPMMEANVREAVSNNVFGLLTLLEAAESVQCKSFVLISSDKAVNPTNVMGATKRVCELILASRPSSMRCTAVRFGNVLGSAGSVVPFMQKQLQRGDALTVTHPEVRRFFMAISEAVGLVLQASAIGGHGEILVLDMGEQIHILQLAHQLAKLSGKPHAQVKFIGLRPGEKLEEELFYDFESVRGTTNAKINRALASLVTWRELSARLDEISKEIDTCGEQSLRGHLKRIVPEYQAPVELKVQPPLMARTAGSVN